VRDAAPRSEVHLQDGATPEGSERGAFPLAELRRAPFSIKPLLRSAALVNSALHSAMRNQGRGWRRAAAVAISILTDLVYPDPISAKGLVTWNRVLKQIDALGEEQRLAFFQAFVPRAEQHPKPSIRDAVNRALEENSGDKPKIALLGLLSGQLTNSYVLSRDMSYAHEVVFDVWSGAAAEVANPVFMALTGRFIVVPYLRPRCVIDVDLAGNLLAFRQADINRLAKLQGSGTSRLDMAKAIIGGYQKEHPNRVMIKSEFRAAMLKHFPGAPVAALDRARIEARPEWAANKGGRPTR
jgi:hypothetical protein